MESHYQSLQNSNSNIELLDAWLDFSALKQQARPQSDKISRLLNKLVDNNREDELYSQLLDIWEKHLTTPYQQNSIPDELQTELPKLLDSAQLQQWQAYCNPTDKTEADWEYISKPEKGYLVPIMTGYKAISELYENSKVANTRDSETDVCFMESVHSVGEWLSVHRLKTIEGLNSALWHYHYVKNWYLCKQSTESGVDEINHSDNNEIITENPEDDLS
ncbi:MAG: hypothetical protein HOM84_07560 [Thiotrichales bacterium]|nr:hypothetical protein [Thiotrichales bacterium]MBT4261084.1 hypothetical protein [Thiotrichales bacterium]MBT4972386.1 hypothetical protein [Thiotrichales bacterium]